MITGYISQIDFHLAPVQHATDALDMKCVEGSKDEATLKPFMETLQSAIDDYGAAIKAIKTLYASWSRLYVALCRFREIPILVLYCNHEFDTIIV